jgi:hypothetical protein
MIIVIINCNNPSAPSLSSLQNRVSRWLYVLFLISHMSFQFDSNYSKLNISTGMMSVNKTTPPLSRSAHAHFDLNVQSLRFAVDDDDDDEHEMDEDNLMNIESERRMITESGTGSVPISIAFPRGQWKGWFAAD